MLYTDKGFVTKEDQVLLREEPLGFFYCLNCEEERLVAIFSGGVGCCNKCKRQIHWYRNKYSFHIYINKELKRLSNVFISL